MEPETPIENPPPPLHPGKIKYLLVALIPLPIGFVIGPARLSDFLQNGKPGGLLIAFNVITIICCVAGAIGMYDGYKKGAWQKWIQGVGVGVVLWVVETFIMSFIGCCAGLSHV